MIRKVAFPLKFKMITVMTVLVVGALAFYVFYAVNLFQKDKSAYVYETNLSSAEGLSEQVSSYLNRLRDSLLLLARTIELENGTRLASEIFQADSDYVHVGTFYKGSEGWTKQVALVREAILSENSIPMDYFDQHVVSKSARLDGLEVGRVLFERVKVQEEFSVLLLGIKINENKAIVGHFDSKRFSNSIRQGGLFERFLVDTNGHIFSHTDHSKLGQRNNFAVEILSQGANNGVKELTSENKKVLVAFDNILPYGLLAISIIPVEVAFQVSDFLVQKSVYFGLFIISVAIIIGVVFSRSLTRPIEVLAGGTQELAKGNFKTDLIVAGRDEIGALSDSFNYMSKQIVRFLEEMQEKARIESELEVAKLVQSTFFPPTDKDLGDVFISSYYSPASECGGDWWGFHRKGNRLLLVMADATGHGVPAALLTATAHCAFHTLIEFSESQPSVIDSSDSILYFMNKAVCNVGQKIMMTCFVAVVDLEERKLNYANSSHNPPLLFKDMPGDVTKESFFPLMESNGPRLGHQADASYSSTTIDIVDGDVLVVFTDGLVEMKDSEGKEWGQRRLLKSLMNAMLMHPTDARDLIMQDVSQFSQEEADDDVSLMLVSFGKQKYARKSICSIDFPPEHANLFSKVREKLSSENIPISLSSENDPSDKIIRFCNSIDQIGDDLKVIFLSEYTDEEMIIKVLTTGHVHHVVGMNGINTESEISAVVKGIIQQNTIPFESLFSVEAIKSVTLTNSKKGGQKLEELLSGIRVDEYFSSPLDYLRHIGDELLTNAFFNAPRNSDGEAIYTDHSRREEVTLPTDQAIQLSVAVDSEKIGIRVSDSFGSLNVETFLQKLIRGQKEKAPEQKDGGAGLGLYLVFNYSNQLIVNIRPGRSTEIISIIENNRRFKKYKERKTSLHVFTKEA